jgi:hypothetical protein
MRMAGLHYLCFILSAFVLLLTCSVANPEIHNIARLQDLHSKWGSDVSPWESACKTINVDADSGTGAASQLLRICDMSIV